MQNMSQMILIKHIITNSKKSYVKAHVRSDLIKFKTNKNHKSYVIYTIILFIKICEKSLLFEAREVNTIGTRVLLTMNIL